MIYISGVISLAVQVIVGTIDYLALQVESTDELLTDLLKVELVVQIVESMFYAWLLYSFSTVCRNITPYRYLDWAFTTPLMLITLSAFLNHDGSKTRLHEFLSEHRTSLVTIVLLNAGMLLFGLLGELGVLNKYISTALGFIPFALMFTIINRTFLHSQDLLKTALFYWFVVVWGMYGVFALMSHALKNVGYNILDLFSKNFFGLFLAYLVFTSGKKLTFSN
jgi:bacteriorhodopsin